MEDLTGKQLDQYQVVEPLGEGGMAAVYKAFQPGMERYVALKILPRMFADDPTFVGRFKQEAKVIAKLTHVHILPIFDFGTAEGYTYIVMPYIKTGDLADMMVGEPLPLPFIRKVISQVGDALHYAHSRGLIHRDIKPSNILIDDHENSLLSDFGIAKIVGGTMQFTQTGAIIGTPAYMSPEQINGEELDGRNDVYSLGIVLYEMVTGRTPFKAETPPAIFVKHLHDPMPPPRTFAPGVSEELEAVILKSLARDREDRYANVSDMVVALKKAIPEALVIKPEVIKEKPEAAPTMVEKEAYVPDVEVERKPVLEETEVAPEIKVPKPEPADKPSRKMPAWVWAVGGLVIVAVIVLGVMFGGDLFGPGEPEPPIDQPPISQPIEEPAEPVEEPVAGPVEEFECRDPLGCVEIPPGQPLHIGYALALNPPLIDFFGAPSLHAIEIAIDEIGLFFGHPIEIVGVNTNCSYEGGEAVHDLMGDPRLVAIIGTTCSSAGEVASEIVSEAGGVIISPTNSRPTLTDPNMYWNPGYLRTAWNDMLEATSMAKFVFNELGVRRVATINEEGPFNWEIVDIFVRMFEELGGEHTEWIEFNPEDVSVSDVLDWVAESEPELIYLALPSDLAVEVVHQIRERSDLRHVMLAGHSQMVSTEFLEQVGGAADGMKVAGVDQEFQNDARFRFDEFYIDRFGEPPGSQFAYYAYDAVMLVFAALERAAFPLENGALVIPRQRLREMLYETRGFPGITGQLSCSEFGDCANPIIIINEVIETGLFFVAEYAPLEDPWFEYEQFFIP